VPSVRGIALAVVAAGLPAVAAAQYEPPRLAPGWAIAFHTVLGAGRETGVPDRGATIAPEFDLLVAKDELAVGPFLAATGGDRHDAVWYGLAAGWSHRLEEHVRLDLLGELGGHAVTVESDYAYEPAGSARFVFVGARAGLHLTGELYQTPALLWARRGGIGLQASARADLGRATVQPGSPPGAPPMAPVTVGGGALTLGVAVVLEW
jgi:hypothetical protein